MSAKAPLVYRLFLLLLPPRFRRDFGADLEAVLVERLRDAPGAAARAWIWVIAVVDVFTSVPAEWTHALRRQRTGHAPRSNGMETLTQDLRYAIRTLRKRPGFAAIVVLTLALAIGANSAIFSIASAVLLRQPPVRDPERLVAVRDTGCGDPRCFSSYPDYLDSRDEQTAIDDLAAFEDVTLNLVAAERSRLLAVERVSGNYFDLLGLVPAAGRLLQPLDDDAAGDPAVAVLSHRFWSSHYGGDAAVVGRTVRLNQGVFTVVGVAPRGFEGLELGGRTDMWVPLRSARSYVDPDFLENRGHRWIAHVVGRLADDASLERARAEMAALSQRLAELHPEARGSRGITVDPPGGYVISGPEPEQVSRFVLLLHGVVGLTLLLACANLANLLLGRAAARGAEMGLRCALGASRGRLLRQLVTESLVLSLAGGLAGILVAAGLISALSNLALPFGFTIADLDPRLDGGVVTFTLGVALVAGLVFGLTPALRGSATAPSGMLREARGGPTAAAARLQGALVAVQIALSLMLLTGAGLFVRTLQQGFTQDYGFPVTRLALLGFHPSLSGHSGGTAALVVRALKERAAAMPGVSAVSAGRYVPLLGGRTQTYVTVDGYEPATDEEMTIELNVVDPGYYHALGLPLEAGREFTPADGPGGARVAVISQTMAERWWPGRNPIGGTLTIHYGNLMAPGLGAPHRVVGVVRETRYGGINEEELPRLTLPLAQNPSLYAGEMIVLARAETEVEPVVSSLATELRALDPAVPITLSSTMGRELRQLLAPQLLAAWLLGGFSILALVLAAVGLYGVVAYGVRRRMPELALRITLGAEAGQLRKLVVVRHIWPLALGVGAGVAGALLVSRVAAAFLLGVGPRDPATVVSAVLVLAGVGLLAMLLPTRRLTRLQPVQVLRVE